MTITKEWCIRMTEIEGDAEIGSIGVGLCDGLASH